MELALCGRKGDLVEALLLVGSLGWKEDGVPKKGGRAMGWGYGRELGRKGI